MGSRLTCLGSTLSDVIWLQGKMGMERINMGEELSPMSTLRCSGGFRTTETVVESVHCKDSVFQR